MTDINIRIFENELPEVVAKITDIDKFGSVSVSRFHYADCNETGSSYLAENTLSFRVGDIIPIGWSNRSEWEIKEVGDDYIIVAGTLDAPNLRINVGDNLTNGKIISDDTLTEDGLRKMMEDPRYWRERDPAYVNKVLDGFQKLYQKE